MAASKRQDSIWWLVVALVLALVIPLGYLAWPEPAVVAADGLDEKLPDRDSGDGGGESVGRRSAAAGSGVGSSEDASRQQQRFQLVWFAPWGDGPGELGKVEPAEGNPEGPMAFAVDGRGRFWVLDQVNQRLVVFSDRQVERTIPLEAASFEDLRVDDRGRAWLLDRLVGKRLLLLDGQGRQLEQVALEGGPIREGGGVTGLFLYDDGVWAEVEHTTQVHLVGADDAALSARVTRGGRLSRDGQWLLAAALEGRRAALVTVRPATDPGSNPRVFARVEFSLPVLHLLLLDSDTLGNVFLAAQLARFSPRPPYLPEAQRIELVVLDAGGNERERLALPVPELELEQFRAFEVNGDGSVFQLWPGRAGAEMRRVR